MHKCPKLKDDIATYRDGSVIYNSAEMELEDCETSGFGEGCRHKDTCEAYKKAKGE